MLVEGDHQSLEKPFLYQQQRHSALRTYVVNYQAFIQAVARLQEQDGDTSGSDLLQRIVLLYSTGRCGSTLLSKLLGRGQGVNSVSEPDFYSMLSVARVDGKIDLSSFQ